MNSTTHSSHSQSLKTEEMDTEIDVQIVQLESSDELSSSSSGGYPEESDNAEGSRVLQICTWTTNRDRERDRGSSSKTGNDDSDIEILPPPKIRFKNLWKVIFSFKFSEVGNGVDDVQD